MFKSEKKEQVAILLRMLLQVNEIEIAADKNELQKREEIFNFACNNLAMLGEYNHLDTALTNLLGKNFVEDKKILKSIAFYRGEKMASPFFAKVQNFLRANLS